MALFGFTSGGGLGLSPLPDADKRLRSYEIGPFTVGGGSSTLPLAAV